MKAGRNRRCCNNCEDNESDDEVEQEEDQDVDKMLKVILKKVSVLPGLEKQLSDIKQSMSVLSEKYDTLLAEHEQSKEKISKLEKMAASTNNKCIYLEKQNMALEQKIQEFEQTTRKHNIEIVGIEQLPDENIMGIVTKIGEKIDVSCADIESARRTHPPRPGPNARPAPIIVAFKSSGTAARDQWLARRRRLADLTSAALTGGALATRVYLNEDLNKATRVLLWNVKNQLHGVFKYIWVVNGKILVKKAEGGNATWVRSENDLSELKKVK
ncbi:uncharacterized protein LOC125238975 [Leguminivora glycinivorella]|uniref:uncharacterized protein LOC125238975 n=1 Tax=Leguminivora glycinivorella TaxID=1035111 RepID=UPI00200C5BEC|nr:uncharacterized protein LOC125238975 [Leguminivora glycinivorella]